LYVSECAVYDIIEMRACMCLKGIYMILLKRGLVCVWMRYVWYYENESLYVSEWNLYDIIKMRRGMW